MCGRFTLRAPASVIAEAFALLEVPALAPRYNIAPTQLVPVLRAGTEPPARQFAWLRWGLIPSWADDPTIGNCLINARCETAADRPAYRAAFRRRRCLLLADGFYEWRSTGRRKQPYLIHFRDDRPFAFAGLWETWEGAGYSVIESCTLLTTTPNTVVAPIHNRMPVILDPLDYDRWLDPAQQNPEALQMLLVPFPSEEMEAYPVSTAVNRPGYEHPACVESVASK